MKALNLFVAVLVVFGLIGCADQSSVTSPASDVPAVGKAAPINNQSGQWSVDKIVNLYGTKQHYLLNGSIDYTVIHTFNGFTLTAGVKLSTTNISLEKSEPVFVNETFVGQGQVSKGNLVVLTKEYPVENGLNLHLEFAVGDNVELRNVSLVASPFIGTER